MTADAVSRRRLLLDGCVNLRDTGGYETADGGSIQFGRLLRSDSPHKLTADGWRHLGEYGVRAVIDLRRPSEMARNGYSPTEDSSVLYHPLPIFDDIEYETVDKPARNLNQLYTLFLENCGPSFVRALRVMIRDGGTSSLVHCAVGKDRTGLTIALALSIAGVANDVIADDYALSETYLAPLYPEWLEQEKTRPDADIERLQNLLQSKHDHMVFAQDLLTRKFDGPQGYLEHAGMKASEMDALKKWLTAA
ncbi:tyrosine-protein phosphatase [Lacibacterium aquatile]|uniref:Tyrosine-protein phosphatase n=1 Tax=Lacibacterium aquatile TaxID=1168082 RepID=A0ABW5DPZ8_9PROT